MVLISCDARKRRTRIARYHLIIGPVAGIAPNSGHEILAMNRFTEDATAGCQNRKNLLQSPCTNRYTLG